VKSSVLVALRVKSSPERAFDVFTNDIGEWWKPDPLFRITPDGDGELAFEGGEGGCLVTRLEDGKVFEIGRVTEWVRGERLAFTWRPANFSQDQITRVEVTFEAAGAETRVTVRHYGWIEIPREHASRHGFPDHVTQLRTADWWRRSMAALDAIVLHDS
jgi:uncharacterized protein YndB with AHSA1/START domain